MNSVSEILKLENLAIGYDQKVLMDSINAVAKAGQFVLFIGANGKGKSTLLRTIVGQLKMINGNVIINGQSIKQLGLRTVAKTIAFVPGKLQIPNEVTVMDMLHFARIPYLGSLGKVDVSDQKIIDEIIAKLSLELLIAKSYNALSDGQRQLVNIARSLVQQTPIILLDEPTANLDIVNRRMVYTLLKQQAQEGKLIVCCSHDLVEAHQYCTHLWLINKFGEFEAHEKNVEVNLKEVENKLFPN